MRGFFYNKISAYNKKTSAHKSRGFDFRNNPT